MMFALVQIAKSALLIQIFGDQMLTLTQIRIHELVQIRVFIFSRPRNICEFF